MGIIFIFLIVIIMVIGLILMLKIYSTQEKHNRKVHVLRTIHRNSSYIFYIYSKALVITGAYIAYSTNYSSNNLYYNLWESIGIIVLVILMRILLELIYKMKPNWILRKLAKEKKQGK